MVPLHMARPRILWRTDKGDKGAARYENTAGNKGPRFRTAMMQNETWGIYKGGGSRENDGTLGFFYLVLHGQLRKHKWIQI